MNKYPVIFVILLLAGMGNFAFSQNKEEEKEWAKKLKELKPMDYKKLVDEKNALQAQANDAQSTQETLKLLKSEMDAKDAEIAKLKKELEDYSSGAVPGVPQKSAEPQEQNVAANKGPVAGLVYKVQIGSFKSKDLTKYFDNNPNFSGDVDHDGSKKYTLGVFTDYWEADKFKNALRDMGVKGAWVVAYKDGRRVNMKDAREGVL